MSGSGWHNRSQRSHIIMIFIPGQSRDKNNKLIALIDARHDIRSRERSVTIITSDRHTEPLFGWVNTLARGEYWFLAGILTHFVWTWVKCMDVIISEDDQTTKPNQSHMCMSILALEADLITPVPARPTAIPSLIFVTGGSDFTPDLCYFSS